MPDPSRIDQIRKALKLAADPSATEAEAQAAAAMAQKLMAKHAITEAMLAEAEDEDQVTTWSITLPSTYFHADMDLLATIAVCNSCRVGYNSRARRVSVYGHQSDLENVSLLWLTLYPAMKRLARRQYAPLDGSGSPRMSDTSWRRSYRIGFGQGVGMKLMAARRQAAAEVDAAQGTSTALVVLDQRAAKVDDRMKGLKKGREAKEPDPEAAAQGQRDGWRATSV